MNNRTVNKIAKLQKANDELQQKIDMLQSIDNWEDWMLANRDLATMRKGEH